jgi:acetoin utilization deacetylase AcuC-like enzyme
MVRANSVLVYSPEFRLYQTGEIHLDGNDVVHRVEDMRLIDPVYTVEKLQYPFPVTTAVPYPENGSRMVACHEALTRFGLIGDEPGQMRQVPPRPATADEIARAHSTDYVKSVAALSQTGGELGESTFVGRGAYESALLSAGAGLTAAEMLHAGTAQNAFVISRPPGHHAAFANAAGFCIFNNVAVTARHCQALGWRKVLVVDWDLHHGDGTQALFYDDPDVLFCSLHQFGPELYPEKGNFDETGAGAGAGYTVNLPLPAKTDADAYLQLFETVIAKLTVHFKPDIILVSAGYDAHFNDTQNLYVWDPAGGLSLTAQTYSRLTEIIAAAAQRYCDGRYIVLLEGGYNLQALANGAVNTASAMLGYGALISESIPPNVPVLRLDVEQYLQTLAAHHPEPGFTA